MTNKCKLVAYQLGMTQSRRSLGEGQGGLVFLADPLGTLFPLGGTIYTTIYYLPPPDFLTFLRPWGSGLANFSYFFSTNFNLVAKKKSSFSDCRTNSLSDDYYFYIYCPRLLLFLFSSVLFLPFFLAAAR